MSEVTGVVPAGPSAIRPANPDNADGVRVMTTGEIHALPEIFAAVAECAKEAGYDVVEIHAARGCLLEKFYPPPPTKGRTSSEETSYRIRIIREVIRAAREKNGLS